MDQPQAPQSELPSAPTSSFTPSEQNPIVIDHKHRPIVGGAFVIVVLTLSILAGGLLFINHWPSSDEPVVAIITPRPSATPTPVTDIPADWKTYTNAEFFQVQYPPNWVTSDQVDKPIVRLRDNIKKDATEAITISLGNDNLEALSLSDWLAEQKWPLAAGQSWKDIFHFIPNIDGQPAAQQNLTGTVYVAKGATILMAENGTGFNRRIYPEEIYLQILSTFKFTK